MPLLLLLFMRETTLTGSMTVLTTLIYCTTVTQQDFILCMLQNKLNS